MNTDELTEEIERANRRLVELRRAVNAGGKLPPIEAALAELSSALEELRVAEEELTAQNAELAVAHAQADFQRHRYLELFMSAPFAQLVTDLRGNITDANRAAGELLAAPGGKLAGKVLAHLVAAADRERFARWMAILKEASHDVTVCAECGGSGIYQIEVARRAAFPCEVNAAPLANRFGAIDSIRWCLRDVSDRARLREMEGLAEEARRKDQFLAVLGHELRNPLAAITLAADILTAVNGDPARRRWAAEVVQRHADQLRRLVEDLLDVSRASHGKITLHKTDVDLRHVVAAAIESCQPLLQGKGHHLEVALPDSPVRVEADPARLTQVVTNLLDNAAKYTPSRGKVELAVRREGGKVLIVVHDSGIGIAGDMLDDIFGAYHQVQRAGELRERGLGLGLALVKELVSLHGGSVRAQSAGEGAGATFTVELPLPARRRGEAAARQAEPAVRPASGLNGHRVLIVDDNADAAELLAEKLRQLGYAVDLAFDGKGGLAAARDPACRIALVDLALPDVDGFEVARTLKTERPDVRLVALTGYSDRASRDRAEEVGFERFLVKPLEPRQVVATLEELVAARG